MGDRLVVSNPLALPYEMPKTVRTVIYSPLHPQGIPSPRYITEDWDIVSAILGALLCVSLFFNVRQRKGSNYATDKRKHPVRNYVTESNTSRGIPQFLRGNNSEVAKRGRWVAEPSRSEDAEQSPISPREVRIDDGGDRRRVNGAVLGSPRARHPIDSALGSWDRVLRSTECTSTSGRRRSPSEDGQ